MSTKLGIGDSVIRQWVKKSGKTGVMSKSDSWTPEKKLQAVNETSSLEGEELGAYLRKHGLHSEDLESWKQDFYRSQRGPGRPRKDPELAAAQKEKKSLERDMRRKDKALAEMTARIVLLKKSRLLWGADEEGES